MTGENKIYDAVSCVRAPEDFEAKVYVRAAQSSRQARSLRQTRFPRPARCGRPMPIRLVVAAAIVGALATGCFAYAAVSTDFFQRSWGDHGMGTDVAWNAPTGKGTEGPAYERAMGGGADAAIVESLADVVEPVGLSVEGSGYTLTVESMVVDENGCGAVLFTLENPNGIGNRTDYGTPGQLVFDATQGDGKASLITMDFEGGGWPSNRCFYDVDTATDTMIHGTMYFSSFDGADAFARGVSWRICWSEEVDGKPVSRDASTGVFVPQQRVAVREFAGEGGVRVWASPFSVRIAAAQPVSSDATGDSADAAAGDSTGAASETIVDELSFTLADGTVQTVVADGQDGAASAVNFYTSVLRSDHSVAFVLSQLLDVQAIESVHASGTASEGATSESAPFDVDLS